MGVVSPEVWYMRFWIGAGVVALLPIYVLLYLIWRKLS
jgi:hypothetical protein